MMIVAVYLKGELSRIYYHIHFACLLKHVGIELFRGIEQSPEEITCPLVLIGQKSVYRLRPKRLVEKAPVQSPSISVWQKHRIEIHSTP